MWKTQTCRDKVDRIFSTRKSTFRIARHSSIIGLWVVACVEAAVRTQYPEEIVFFSVIVRARVLEGKEIECELVGLVDSVFGDDGSGAHCWRGSGRWVGMGWWSGCCWPALCGGRCCRGFLSGLRSRSRDQIRAGCCHDEYDYSDCCVERYWC